MDKINNGGPAFPFGQTDHVSGQLVNGWGSEGMTLRDYFAAKAMQAAATNPTGADGFTFEGRAEWAYEQADAMLAEREKPADGVSPEHLRIKPVTIRIGELDVPEPMKEAPKQGTTYYTTDLNAPSLYWAMEWQNSDSDKLRLKRNQCHLESRNAIEHGRALVAVSGGKE